MCCGRRSRRGGASTKSANPQTCLETWTISNRRWNSLWRHASNCSNETTRLRPRMEGSAMMQESNEPSDTGLKRFRDETVEQRVLAVAAWSREGVGAFPSLLAALGDPEWRVRKSAVDAVVALGPRGDTVNGVIEGLRSADNAALRNSAAEVLVRFGTNAVLPLLSALGSADPDLQKFIADILGEIGDRRATPALIRLLSQHDDNVAMAAIDRKSTRLNSSHT